MSTAFCDKFLTVPLSSSMKSCLIEFLKNKLIFKLNSLQLYYIKVHNKSWEKHVFALKMNVGSQTDNLITPPTLIFIRTISISWTFATGFTGLSQKFIKAERILFIFFELHRTAARTRCSTAISPAEFLIGYESVKQNSLNWELKGRHNQQLTC